MSLHMTLGPEAQGLTFLWCLHGVEESQGPLAAGRRLRVAALLPGQVQLGTAEWHIWHGVEDLPTEVHKTLHTCASREESTD